MINIKGAVVRRGHFLDYIDLLKVKSSVLSYNSNFFYRLILYMREQIGTMLH